VKKHNVALIFFVISLLGLSAQTGRSQSFPQDSRDGGRGHGSRYTVNASDTLDINFQLTPDFDQTVTVQPDGYITLRDAGDVLAAGKTLAELTTSVNVAYSKILRAPMISVDLKDFEKPYVLVGGQVGKPGKLDWRGELTLTQAIAIAGGFNDNAKHSQVLLFRKVSEEWAEAKLINVKQMLRSGDLRSDVVLQPGDMVYVPKNAISKIKPYIPVPTLGLYSNQF
jgi:polysaccharide export outer membrane protein